MNIFVGNLSFEAQAADVQKLFEGYGNVASVAIVMRKEKKAPKSRGFGFVAMPDEGQALAAIAGLNGKEFMGRALSVNPARPKTETRAESKPKPRVEESHHPKKEKEEKRVWRNSIVRRPGTYKGGRRSIGYMKRKGISGMQEEAKPRTGSKDNPMRWRKRTDQPRPWQKTSVEHKPWKKPEEGGRFPKKTEGGVKPWRRAGAATRPWKRAKEGSRPREETGGEIRTWNKPV